MADTDQAATEAGAPEIQVKAQFIRDLSFESPNVLKLIEGPGTNPNLQLEINVNAQTIKEGLFESVIDLKAEANSKEGIIYDLEIIYGGLFAVSNIRDEALEPFLLVNCPALLFPFLRRIVADVTREGGFPPLFLDPIDFASLYLQRKQAGTSNTDTMSLN